MNDTMTKKKAHKPGSATIALNKRARHEYFIEEEFEAGLSLQGWEVKSLRAGKANIGDSYVTFLKDGEAYLFGATFTPLTVASSHVVCDPTRTRKLLLKRRELDTLLRPHQPRGLHRGRPVAVLEKRLVQDEDWRSQR